MFDDDKSKSKIISANSPFEVKRLGSNVQNFDLDKWKSHAENIAVKAVTLKFQVSDAMTQALRQTKGKRIVEASRDRM